MLLRISPGNLSSLQLTLCFGRRKRFLVMPGFILACMVVSYAATATERRGGLTSCSEIVTALATCRRSLRREGSAAWDLRMGAMVVVEALRDVSWFVAGEEEEEEVAASNLNPAAGPAHVDEAAESLKYATSSFYNSPKTLNLIPQVEEYLLLLERMSISPVHCSVAESRWSLRLILVRHT